MVEYAQIKQQLEDGKNKNNVRCQFCNSLILKEQQAAYVDLQFKLPLMHQKQAKNQADVDIATEEHQHFWLVPDMFMFENIGFSNTVDNKKYLICADCDMGPVGFHDTTNKKCYVALRRVRHGNEKLENAETNDVQ